MWSGYFTNIGQYVSHVIHHDPYYHRSEWIASKALTPIEGFMYHQIQSSVSYTTAAPFTRLKTMFQLKKTMIEYNIDSSTSQECMVNPSLISIAKTEGINGLFKGNIYSVIRIFAQNMLHLVIKKGIRKRFFKTRRNDSYLKYIFKTFISGYIGNVIAKNFTYYLLINAVKSRMGIIHSKSYRFGIFESAFISTNISGFMYRFSWFMSVYMIEPYVIGKSYWLKRITRKCIPLIIPYCFYTVRNRQIITNETLYDAARNLISNHGVKSLFDGLSIKIMDEVIVLIIREIMGLLKYHYADWKYDISGNRKRRKGIVNLSKLCKYRNVMLSRENLLVYGYIHEFMQEDIDIFIPLSLINFIEKQFVHDIGYDILDKDINEFMMKLNLLSFDKKNDLDQFMVQKLFEEKLKNLINNAGFQYIWKQRMIKIINIYWQFAPKCVNYLNYISSNGSYSVITYYCDICNDSMKSRSCRFWKCGHSFCNKCQQNIIKNDSKCKICQTKLNLTQYCRYSIMLRDFDSF